MKIAFGRDLITGVIEILEERGYENTIGILDSDFHNLNKTTTEYANLFFTDTHDIETLILKSDAIDILMDQYCIKDKLEDFLKEHGGSDIRNVLLSLVSPLGYLKWVNSINQWGIIFKPKDVNGQGLKIEDFIPTNTMKFSGHKKWLKQFLTFQDRRLKQCQMN